MKAIICPKYGPPEVLQLKQVARPIPKDNEVLIKNNATTVLMGDCEIRGNNFPQYSLGLKLLVRLGFGIRGPRNKILGQQLAGEIKAVGKNVTRFKEGDQVFAATGLSMGAYAEYTCLRETAAITKKPVNMTFEEASTIPIGGSEALFFLNQVNITRGQRILINGAGGSIGIIAVQLAKNNGAEVTAVDSAGKFDMVRSLGADHVIDYLEEDFTERGETYDFIFDIVGKAPFEGCMGSLVDGGVYMLGNGSVSRGNRAGAKKQNKITLDGPADYTSKYLVILKSLIEGDKLKTFIDRTYLLEQMAEAHWFVEQGGKKGNVVVTVSA
jgi:NADPH:quinone reductase-like Zn-dependent oxidoreductase